MRRTLKLTLNEIKHLKWTVLVTALALTLFTASLFSVLFVYNDLSDNVFNYFDSTNESLTFYVEDVTIDQTALDYRKGLFVGQARMLTYMGTIVADNGNVFEMEEKVEEDGKIHVNSYYGRAVCATDLYLSRYADVMANVPLPKEPWQILLLAEIAEKLQVKAGDKVTIAGYELTVCGVYDSEQYNWDYFDLAYPFVISVDTSVKLDEINIQMENSSSCYNAYLALKRNGINAKIGSYTQTLMDNLSLVNAFLIAVAVVIFIVNLLILYATFSVILHNRRAYICRLKVLGASDLLVFATYFVIIVALLVLISVSAFFLSQAIVSGIMDACGEAFGSEFVTSVSFSVVGVYFVLITVLLGLLCYLSVRKIDNRAIVTATRSD